MLILTRRIEESLVIGDGGAPRGKLPPYPFRADAAAQSHEGRKELQCVNTPWRRG